MRAVVWHYTHETAFREILGDGAIKPATKDIGPGEQGIVWFSTNSFWEETVFKGLVERDGSIRDLGMREMLNAGMRLFRIGVRPETAPFNWRELQERSGMAEDVARSLAKSARNRGARPNEWRGTFNTVTRNEWVAVEEFRNGEWVSIKEQSPEDLLKSLG